jgi:8-oxo-dGTP diphosphatase
MSDQSHTLGATIRGLVARLDPFDAHEARDQSFALGWIDSGAELFRRVKPAKPPVHLVSYFLVVDQDHVLLVDHINAGLWLPSGGHVEPGEDPRETVRREVQEELAIEAEFIDAAPLFLTCTAPVGASGGHVDVSLWFLLRGDRRAAIQFDRAEFHKVQWFHKDALPHERCEPQLGRFMAKLSAGRTRGY